MGKVIREEIEAVTEWANVGRALMMKHSVIMRYYLTGLTADGKEWHRCGPVEWVPMQ